MERASQPQPAPPCPCQQELGDALPWLVVALAIVMALERLGRRRKKKDENADGAASDGADDGDRT